jgi:Predicted UDP-glucose 6-dehydrogenase
MRIAVIGTGYVGLVSGACFSEFGVDVVCVDKDSAKIESLRSGRMPIFEPGLDKLVENNVKDGRLAFSTDVNQAVKGADAVFIAVGTPSRRGDGHADLSYVYAAAKEIAQAVDRPTVVVTKSTVPVGTGTRSPASCARPGPRASSTSPPTRNSCAKARPSAISCAPTGSSSAPRRAGARGDAPALPAALSAGDADPVHQHRDGGADQIRRQHLPRHQDHLHQRDRRSLREGGRQCQ